MTYKKKGPHGNFTADEKQQEVIYRNSDQGICTLNSDLRVTSWSDTMEDLTGFSNEEIVGRELFKETYSHLFPMKKVFNEAVLNRASLTIDHWNKEKKLWFRISLFPVDDSLFVTLRNITEEKNRYAELAALKNLQKYVLNSTSDLIWAIDKEYKLLLGNDSYFQMMWKSLGREIENGDNVLQTSGTLDKRGRRIKEWKSYYDMALKGIRTVSTVAVKDSSADFLYEVTFDPVWAKDAKEEILGIACFARDISERAKHLESIEKQNSQLREIAWLQSHEMRAPLSNLLGLTDLILSSEDLDEKEELISNLRNSAVKIDRIILEIVQKISGNG